MAIIAPTISVPFQNDDSVVLVQWINVTEADTCSATDDYIRYADRSVQFEGTFGGATAIIQGSLDGTNFHNLHDPFGNNLSTTSATFAAITELARQYKPTFSGGSSQSITVTLIFKKVI